MRIGGTHRLTRYTQTLCVILHLGIYALSRLLFNEKQTCYFLSSVRVEIITTKPYPDLSIPIINRHNKNLLLFTRTPHYSVFFANTITK